MRVNKVYLDFSLLSLKPAFDLHWPQNDAGSLDRLQPERPHKMTHLTLAGRDRPRLTFSPTSLYETRPRLKLKRKPTQRFLAHLFSLAYMLLMQDGSRAES